MRYRDDPVRTFWVFDRLGTNRVQVWLDISSNNLTVVAAELDPSSPTRWGRR